MEQARAVLDSLILVTLSTAVCERAAMLEPDLLRSLDSLHLAAALEVGDELEGLVTYDRRMAESARALGISVIAPA
jgi:predicted nucleic acid-binding protein